MDDLAGVSRRSGGRDDLLHGVRSFGSVLLRHSARSLAPGNVHARLFRLLDDGNRVVRAHRISCTIAVRSESMPADRSRPSAGMPEAGHRVGTVVLIARQRMT